MAVAAENMLLVAILQTGIVAVALGFSIWAAIASSRQARAAEEQLISIEKATLLVHWEDLGLDPLAGFQGDTRVDFTRPTIWKLHNYSGTVAFISWQHARHFLLPANETPPPLKWEDHVGGALPFGVVVPPEGDSQHFNTTAHDSVSFEQRTLLLETGRWFFQGFAVFTDLPGRLNVLLFTFVFDRESNEFRIFQTDSGFSEDWKYNSCRYNYRPSRWRMTRRRIARYARMAAEKIEPKPR